MRIATLILGLVLCVGLFIQSLLIFGLSGAIDDEASAAAGALGLLAAFLWLIAAVLVIPAPRGSLALFLLAAVACFAGANNFPDLSFWGAISLGLAVFAFFGWRGKRKADSERRLLLAAAQSQRALAGMVTGAEAPVARLSTPRPLALAPKTCLSCGSPNAPDARFCPECGAVLTSLASVS
jgi:hypothetical protein